MIAIIGFGGSSGSIVDGLPMVLATAIAPSLDALMGRAKSEKRPRLDKPELMLQARRYQSHALRRRGNYRDSRGWVLERGCAADQPQKSK